MGIHVYIRICVYIDPCTAYTCTYFYIIRFLSFSSCFFPSLFLLCAGSYIVVFFFFCYPSKLQGQWLILRYWLAECWHGNHHLLQATRTRAISLDSMMTGSITERSSTWMIRLSAGLELQCNYLPRTIRPIYADVSSCWFDFSGRSRGAQGARAPPFSPFALPPSTYINFVRMRTIPGWRGLAVGPPFFPFLDPPLEVMCVCVCVCMCAV